MKRIAVLLIVSLLAISDTSVAQAKTYRNCFQLTGDFPYGVAQGYYRVGTSNARINRKIYTSKSESWLKSSVTVSGLKELMDFVHEDESLI